ncbi:MAG: histidine phosphatase family protein [Betaproteobacteria bacterium]
MICKLFVFRHAETFDNKNEVFSGWRDSKLTPKGILEAREIAEQLAEYKIDYAFTSHLNRAKKTLKIVLQNHPSVPVFVDDRLIERCYGFFHGRTKKRVSYEDPEFYKKFHRGYDTAPPEGESLKMVENRVQSFLYELGDWLRQNPGNVAISCHNNSIRPMRRIFEKLDLTQMCTIETPQDRALIYNFDLKNVDLFHSSNHRANQVKWDGVLISNRIKLATDPQNLLRKYYQG